MMPTRVLTPADPHTAEIIVRAATVAQIATREAERIVAKGTVTVREAAQYVDKLRLLDRAFQKYPEVLTNYASTRVEEAAKHGAQAGEILRVAAQISNKTLQPQERWT